MRRPEEAVSPGAFHPDALRSALDLREGMLAAWIAAACLSLIAATWPLWIGTADFPAVPLFSWALAVPRAVDLAALTGMIAALLVILPLSLRPGRWGGHRLAWTRLAWGAFLIAAVELVAWNQQRWQPWLWEFALLGMLFALAPRGSVLPLARALVIGVYVHSAISKLDYSFVTTHGPELVDGFLANFGAALGPNRRGRMVAASLLPIGELAAACLLIMPATRRFGLWLAAAMHGALMLALGPFGLNHRPGVLLWNLCFLGQNAILFSRDSDSRTESGARSIPVGKGARLLTVLWIAMALGVPVLDWFGRIDPWLGWGLYASRPARMRLYVHESAVERLPVSVQQSLEPPAVLGEWRRVRLDRWSLHELRAPISPQLRFSYGVALSVIGGAGLGPEVRIELDTEADRWTGARQSKFFDGADAIQQQAALFRLNVRPRGETPNRR